MKRYNIAIALIFSSLMLFTFSCNEQEFLEEVVPDQLVLENAYSTEEGFQSAMWYMYAQIRSEFYVGHDKKVFDYQAGTDMLHPNETQSGNFFTFYDIDLDPSSGTVSWHWNRLFKIIANANTIISRLEFVELNAEKEKRFEAEAKFFRGFSYRVLGGLYGGVPVITEEIIGPKKDFTRSTQDQVFEQAVADLKFAAENLPGITEVNDAQVSNVTAYHALAEAYLCLEDFSSAEQAATMAIDDPNTALMTSRFGTLASTNPGDAYWDLFRAGNQQRSAGNTEALWVIQQEADVPGGSAISTNTPGGTRWERVIAPLVRARTKVMDQATRQPVLDNSGNLVQSNNIWPASDLTGGRGIGWLIPTYYYTNTVWEDESGSLDFQDNRNANHNLVRKFPYNNPNEAWYNDTLYVTTPEDIYQYVGIVESFGHIETATYESKKLWPRGGYPYWTKVTTPDQHPEGVRASSYAETKALTGGAGTTYRDFYMFRLAETYLIRAEARLRGNNAAGAAEDINVVRNRANATPVAAADVDINYILDERARELNLEEKRRLTLERLGLLIERTRQYNAFHSDATFDSEIQEHYKLFPIPLSFIEANTEAEIQQNPGYN